MGKKIKNYKGKGRTQQRGKPMTQKQRWGEIVVSKKDPESPEVEKLK
jgi:hypothetical protein